MSISIIFTEITQWSMNFNCNNYSIYAGFPHICPLCQVPWKDKVMHENIRCRVIQNGDTHKIKTLIFIGFQMNIDQY